METSHEESLSSLHVTTVATKILLLRSDKELTLERSAFGFLYDGQSTLKTQLINPNFLLSLPHRRGSTVSLEITSLFN